MIILTGQGTYKQYDTDNVRHIYNHFYGSLDTAHDNLGKLVPEVTFTHSQLSCHTHTHTHTRNVEPGR